MVAEKAVARKNSGKKEKKPSQEPPTHAPSVRRPRTRSTTQRITQQLAEFRSRRKSPKRTRAGVLIAAPEERDCPEADETTAEDLRSDQLRLRSDNVSESTNDCSPSLDARQTCPDAVSETVQGRNASLAARQQPASELTQSAGAELGGSSVGSGETTQSNSSEQEVPSETEDTTGKYHDEDDDDDDDQLGEEKNDEYERRIGASSSRRDSIASLRSNVSEYNRFFETSETREICEKNSYMPADTADVIYLDRMPEPSKWTDQRCMREKERCFPEVRCRVRPLRNGGVLLSHFQTESDFAVAKSIDWESPVGKGEPPFGGVPSVRQKKFDRPSELVLTVRIVVEEDSRATWVTRRLREEGFRNCKVTEVGKPFGKKPRGKCMRAMKVVMSNQKDVARIVREGVYLGGRPTIATPWKMYRAALLCARCQKRNCSRNTCRAKQPRCATCAGPHETRKCKSKFTECCWCHQDHPATWVYCPSRLEFLRHFAHDTGLPLPRYAKFVSQPVISSNFDGRSYSNVGAQPGPQSQAQNRPNTGSDIPQPRSIARQAAAGFGQQPARPISHQVPGRQPDRHVAPHPRVAPRAPAAVSRPLQPIRSDQASNRDNYAPQPPAVSRNGLQNRAPRIDLTGDPLEETIKSLKTEMREIRLQNEKLTSTLRQVLTELAECVPLISSATQGHPVSEQSQSIAPAKHPRISPAKIVGNIRRPIRGGISRPSKGGAAAQQRKGKPKQPLPPPNGSKQHPQRDQIEGSATELAVKLQKVLSLVASVGQNGK